MSMCNSQCQAHAHAPSPSQLNAPTTHTTLSVREEEEDVCRLMPLLFSPAVGAPLDGEDMAAVGETAAAAGLGAASDAGPETELGVVRAAGAAWPDISAALRSGAALEGALEGRGPSWLGGGLAGGVPRRSGPGRGCSADWWIGEPGVPTNIRGAAPIGGAGGATTSSLPDAPEWAGDSVPSGLCAGAGCGVSGKSQAINGMVVYKPGGCSGQATAW